MSKLVYIYKDQGCIGTDNMKRWLSRHMSKCNVEYVSADDIRSGILQDNNPSALFIGGGESRFYNQKLRRIGRKNINEYIADGGQGFFFCAGSGYAAQRVFFRENSDRMNTVIALDEQHGQLGLFKGDAIWDIRDFRQDGDHRHVAKIEYSDVETGIYYYKGPYFDNLTDNDDVLSRFGGLTSHPAVIKSSYGRGSVISCSIHPEYSAQMIIASGVKKGLSAPSPKICQDSIDDFSRYILTDLISEAESPKLELNIRKKLKEPAL